MREWPKLLSTFLFLATLLATSLAGCKQGEGELCQLTSDCEIGLTCNPVTGTCQSSVTDDGGMDAGSDSGTDGGADGAVDAPDDAGDASGADAG